MKKRGVLNPDLSKTIADIGHTDKLVICDAGLPIPPEANRIDLALCKGIPSFMDTLNAILEDMVIEKAILAEHIKTVSPDLWKQIEGSLGDVPVEFIPHVDFKAMLPTAKGIVRTGEFTPYANIYLVSGVKGLFEI